ncbi:MAG: acetyltransferase [Clostridia bacterium]|nr:acetyltransferase [Clostridia bacterium]
MCIIGGSGHAKVVADIIEAMIDNGYNAEIIGFLDDDSMKTKLLNYPRLGDTSFASELAKEGISFIIGIGNNAVRKRIAESLHAHWIKAIHPKAIVSPYASIGDGSVIMPGCVINAEAAVGCHVVGNTSSSIDHDCRISDYVHIAPHATLCGNVWVGECTHVGAGATIIQNIKVGESSVIGAGSVVVRDIPSQVTVKGVPAR